MANVNEFWREDPRWGQGQPIASPVLGTESEGFFTEIDKTVERARRKVTFFEESYPEHHWWRSEFVTAHPVVALLLQSVNDELAFSSLKDLTDLAEMVASVHEHRITETARPDVKLARLAFSALMNSDPSEQALAYDIMSEGDRQELQYLLDGQSRVSVVS